VSAPIAARRPCLRCGGLGTLPISATTTDQDSIDAELTREAWDRLLFERDELLAALNEVAGSVAAMFGKRWIVGSLGRGDSPMNDLHRASSNLADVLIYYAGYVAGYNDPGDTRSGEDKARSRETMRKMLEDALEGYGHALR
jgi:hypothetical protein